MKKLFVLLALMLFCLPSYAQIWEGSGGSAIDEGLGFGSSDIEFDWDEFTGDKCTVTFQSIDGVYSQSAVVPVGVPSSYVMPAIDAPNRTGYDFGGWSYLVDYPTPITIPDNFTATQTYYAIYTPHLHNVTYMIDNSVYYVMQNVPYGTSTIPLPPDPTYPDLPQDDALYYWQGLPETMPDNDITVTAVYGIAYWGMDIDQSTGDVTYLYRAEGMSPISVNGATINNWSNSDTSWKSFVYDIARPCMLKSDGTVDYYLNRDDQRYKEDGITASDYNNTSYDGNAMVEFKKMYIKITQPSTDVIRVLFSKVKVDNDFTAYAFTRANGTEADKVYLGMYIGSNVSGKIRSIVGGNYSLGDPANYETLAAANGTGWNIEYYSLRNYINLLTTLVMKTPNIAVKGYHINNPSGYNINSNIAYAPSNAFYTPATNNEYRFKLFWISDYFINNHLVRGIAYDFDNSCWKYRNTPPYSFSSLTDYSSCETNNLTFNLTGDGAIGRLLDRMTVKDNLLFPYSEYTVTSSSSGNSITAYGNSEMQKIFSTSGTNVSNYIFFGAHSIYARYITGYNNIWSVNVMDSYVSGWSQVVKCALTYMP